MKNTLIMFFAAILFSCSSGKKTSSTLNENEMKTTATVSITETYWKLTELMGQPVTASGTTKREMHIILKKTDSMVIGSGGCNTFRGRYSLQENTLRINFSQMAATMMACADMGKESEFMEVLGKVDNYAIAGNTLSFNKARMAPLAKFEAVLMK